MCDVARGARLGFAAKGDGTVRRKREAHLPSTDRSCLVVLDSRVARSKLPQEIAKRTREVLEQFERNTDQQNFLLMIFEKLDERTSQVMISSARPVVPCASTVPSKLTTMPSPIESKSPSEPHMHTLHVTIMFWKALDWLVKRHDLRIGAVYPAVRIMISAPL